MDTIMSSKLFSSAIVENTLPVVKDKEGNPGPVAVIKSMPTSDSKVLTQDKTQACSSGEASDDGWMGLKFCQCWLAS
jgi:hypothetical protein